MKKIRTFFEYLAAFVLILILLSVITSVIIVKFYGEEIQDYAMESINSQLDTKFSIDEAGISVFKNFPNTAVFFTNVTVWSGHKFKREEFHELSRDTLFVANRIFVQFNIQDLIRKRYTVKRLEAVNGTLWVLIDSDGNSNFKLNNKDSNHDNNDLIEIKGVKVKNLSVHYINHAKEITGKGVIEDMFFEGNFSRQKYVLKVGGNAFLEEITNHNIKQLSNQEVKSDLSLSVENNKYSIDKGALFLGDLSAGISGEFTLNKEIGNELDLHLTGKRISIEWISELLESRNKAPKGIHGSGNINLTVDLTGLSSPTVSPHIEGSFSTQNASLNLSKYAIDMRSVTLIGKFSNGAQNSIRSSFVNLNSFSTSIKNSTVTGSLQLENLLEPNYNMQIAGNINASDLALYMSDIPLEIQQGTFKPALTIKGAISGMTKSTKKVSFSPSGTIEVQNLAMHKVQSNLAFQGINGIIELTSTNIGAKIRGILAETEIEMDLSIKNPFTSSDKKQFIQIDGSIYSPNVDIDHIINELVTDDDGEKTFSYPMNIGVNLDYHFDKIIKGDIQTRKVTGILIYKYPAIYLDPIYLETMSGVINSRVALVDLHKPKHQLIINSAFRNVDVKNIFLSFNDFGQVFLTNENIAGSISGESEFLTSINNDFSINTSDIVSQNNFIIENGELINFQPMIELSDFLKIDKLEHITFSTISNTILVNENKITIPEMNIKSSAINLQASGIHNFNKTFEYHLATKLSEFLFNKANSKHNKEFDVAIDKDDKRTIFLILYDEGDGMVVKFDEQQGLKKIRNDLKEEKTELKVVLNEELGLYKKDQDVIKTTNKTEEPKFKFELSDDELNDTINNDSTIKPKWWKRKKETDKKPEFEFVIADNDI